MTSMGPSHAGRLLVASPVIGDPNFERTVVLLLEHSEQGALGLVLNRPSELDLLDPLPQWYGLAATPSVVFVGGPVEQERAIGLASADPDRTTEGFSPVLGRIGTLDLHLAPEDIGGVDEIRVYAGYAGWGAGQLESELLVDAWFVVDAGPDDVLHTHPDRLWSAVLRRQGGDLAVLAGYPPDPSLN